MTVFKVTHRPIGSDDPRVTYVEADRFRRVGAFYHFRRYTPAGRSERTCAAICADDVAAIVSVRTDAA